MKSGKNEITREFEMMEIPEESRLTGLHNILNDEDHREDLLRKYFSEVRGEKLVGTTIDMRPRDQSVLVPPPGMSQEQIDILSLNAKNVAREIKPAASGRKVYKYNI